MDKCKLNSSRFQYKSQKYWNFVIQIFSNYSTFYLNHVNITFPFILYLKKQSTPRILKKIIKINKNILRTMVKTPVQSDEYLKSYGQKTVQKSHFGSKHNFLMFFSHTSLTIHQIEQGFSPLFLEYFYLFLWFFFHNFCYTSFFDLI